jgi:hypothetical protein
VENIDQEVPGRRVKLQMPRADKCAIDFISGKPIKKGQTLHFILEVKDNGAPSLVAYKRVVVQITNPGLKGGRESSVSTTAEWLEMMGHI